MTARAAWLHFGLYPGMGRGYGHLKCRPCSDLLRQTSEERAWALPLSVCQVIPPSSYFKMLTAINIMICLLK